MSFSVSTVDEPLTKIFEPNAPLPTRRLQAMETISEASILTGLTYMPIIPFITDTEEQIETTISEAKKRGAKYILAASMTLQGKQKERFFRLLERTFPELIPKYHEIYPEKSYGPVYKYSKILNENVDRVCKKYSIWTRIPKPEFVFSEKQSKIDIYS